MNPIENEITVNVLFFGAARDAAGADEVAISAPQPATAGSVKAIVFSRYSRLSRFEKSLMVAVNQVYATDSTKIDDRDEVAFLPPVSGG